MIICAISSERKACCGHAVASGTRGESRQDRPRLTRGEQTRISSAVNALLWIIAGGVAMCAIALVGAVALPLSEAALQRLVRPLVAFAAGSLLGGALLHMIPEAAAGGGRGPGPYLSVLAGFALFLAVEQLLHWHHCHRAAAECRQPLGLLMLVGDALHNFLGGLAVGAAFVADVRVGLTTWLAAAAHELPQELGDFGVLVHAGWPRGKALAFNALSASTFLLGGLIAWSVSARMDTRWLLGLAAGSFLYIGASDLVPEVNRQRDLRVGVLHLVAFVAGAGLLALLRLVFEG
jgi:zinc and cadmium transporter